MGPHQNEKNHQIIRGQRKFSETVYNKRLTLDVQCLSLLSKNEKKIIKLMTNNLWNFQVKKCPFINKLPGESNNEVIDCDWSRQILTKLSRVDVHFGHRKRDGHGTFTRKHFEKQTCAILTPKKRNLSSFDFLSLRITVYPITFIFRCIFKGFEVGRGWLHFYWNRGVTFTKIFYRNFEINSFTIVELKKLFISFSFTILYAIVNSRVSSLSIKIICSLDFFFFFWNHCINFYKVVTFQVYFLF